MIKLQLPELFKIYWKKPKSKNIIKQLLIPSEKLDYRFVANRGTYTVIEGGAIKYALVSNKTSAPAEYEHVILTSKLATKASLIAGAIHFKEWLKHPMLTEYSAEDVCASWSSNFHFIEEDTLIGRSGLREPQIAALYSILSHLKISDDIGTVVMPTGTGKTETMLSTLIANKCTKVLVTVPSDALRTQIFNKFYSLGLLKAFGVIGGAALYPKVGSIYENFQSDEEMQEFVGECNAIVTTMGILSYNTSESLAKYSDLISHLFIDEAHHIEANSWLRVRKAFSANKILQFTATPFRNDRKRLEGKIIFNFSLKRAQEQGYFKPIKFLSVHEYDFKKGDHLIAEKAIGQLNSDMLNGFDHILMARCETKARAQEVFEIYKTHEHLNPVLVYSGVAGKREILEGIIKGHHKIIVAVNMLGEGFDLPQLKIAAFHDIRKSLPITLQFAGRFTRTATSNLGDATFIANLADAAVAEELSELYAQDSDWNLLLSKLSSDEIDEQIDFDEFINGFQHLNNSQIPFQNIRFALSTVAFKNNFNPSDKDISNTYDLKKFADGIPNYENLNINSQILTP
jgi:superfamily II DNA or RNA helicase